MERWRKFILLLAVTFSFGGFTFYAAVVVPIGSAVLDSMQQGFVTRRVAHFVHLATAVSWLLLCWEFLATRSLRSRRDAKIWLALLFVYLGCLITLVLLHPQMDRLLDEPTFSVLQPARFYQLHRIYLLTISLQWMVTIGLLWMLDRRQSGEMDKKIPTDSF